jgi:hypothetical protein
LHEEASWRSMHSTSQRATSAPEPAPSCEVRRPSGMQTPPQRNQPPLCHSISQAAGGLCCRQPRQLASCTVHSRTNPCPLL